MEDGLCIAPTGGPQGSAPLLSSHAHHVRILINTILTGSPMTMLKGFKTSTVRMPSSVLGGPMKG